MALSLSLVHGRKYSLCVRLSLVSLAHLLLALTFSQWVVFHDPAVFRLLCLGFASGQASV